MNEDVDKASQFIMDTAKRRSTQPQPISGESILRGSDEEYKVGIQLENGQRGTKTVQNDWFNFIPRRSHQKR
ncbi:hypothetical protein HYPSUDRAFT_67190 [Hypholoma sublateritium FD-334 SS-4]|uniref:Uncharacterized protein n=1 Tax=Hypholoma sublateritium (strain FD-334 SS-4) TaxID=945553 RepID=A0A0D2NT84_HYPSF|nr:hypothetical protein HYPSUDRAFT_67190 [Hypholoma sublateritium FD-334 SS-4]